MLGEITDQIVRPQAAKGTSVEAEHLLLVLEEYFNTDNPARIERKHARLLNRYRASPLGGPELR